MSFSWFYEHFTRIYNEEIDRYPVNLEYKHDFILPSGRTKVGFSQSHLTYLLDSLYYRCNPNGSLKDKLDCLKLIQSMASPFFVKTQPLIHPSSYIFYNRNGRYESESLHSTTQFSYDHAELVENLDKEILNDLVNNAGTIASCKQKDISNTVNLVIDQISWKSQVLFCNAFWIVVPPEFSQVNLLTQTNLNQRVTQNLYFKGFYADTDFVPIYSSRLIPENKILVGVRDWKDLFGYVFTPYCMRIYDGNKSGIIYAKKLLRSGSNYFATITLED